VRDGGKVAQAGEVRSTRIEALRAVAALGVVIGHVVLLAPHIHRGSFANRLMWGGGLGVFLFFALTGYLLFWPFVRRFFADGAPISIGRYAANRALRILPLYYVALAVLLVLDFHGGSATQWLRFATFTQSFFKDTVATVDAPMWSLVVEVQFYVLLPLLAFGLARLSRRSVWRAAAILGVLGLASLAVWWHYVHRTQATDLRWRFSLPATFLNFVPGMLLALLRLELNRRPRRRLPSSDVLLVAGVACWALIAEHATDEAPVCAVAAFLVIGAVVLPVREGRLVKLLDLRALGLIGLASYSLYLWHLPVMSSLERHTHTGFAGLLVLSLAVCLAIAGVSYAVVERPFLRLRRRWGSTVPAEQGAGGLPEVRPPVRPAKFRLELRRQRENGGLVVGPGDQLDADRHAVVGDGHGE
jgi:peptidoglycan/LPS O-acetylase OafA/YrhL